MEKATGVKPKLTKSSGGVLEVTVNDKLIFSKKKLKRFPKKGEVLELMEVENFPKDEAKKEDEKK